MTLLVIGGSGFLGREIVRQAVAAGERVAATYLRGPPGEPSAAWHGVDVREGRQVAELVSALRPDAVINTAYRRGDPTSIDEGAANVAASAVAVGAHLVHVSSDAVFSGAAVRYDEAAIPDPITPYGLAKALAETRTAVIAPYAAIVRTSLIIGRGSPEDLSPHERLVHDLAAGRAGGVLFTDDVRCPVHVADLAEGLLELASFRHAGVYHLAGTDAVSRHELGCLIARRDGLDPAALPAGRRAATGPSGALDVRLDCTLTRQRLRTKPRGAYVFLR